MITSLKQVRLSSARYFIPGALLTSTILLYGLIYNGHIDSPTRYYEYLTAASPPPPPTGFTFHTPASDDPEFPRTVFDMQPGTWLSDHPPVNLLVREGYWIAQALVEAWNNQFTCRSGLRCITQWNEGHSTEGMDVVLTLSKDPGFRQIMDRDKTKLAFLGMEPYHYDVNVDETFDIKASVYQSEMSTTDFRWTAGPPDIRHVWTTYSEFPWASYLLPEALPNWDKLDKSRAVMFVSSNSCPQHRRDFIHELVKRGLDVWYVQGPPRTIVAMLTCRSFGTCASEHENTDRVAKLKELCEDGSLWQIPDWRKAKSCVSEHFKVSRRSPNCHHLLMCRRNIMNTPLTAQFIISIENSLHNDYVSEKFFHPFGIGTVPLYWGPRNIDVYAPGPNSYVNLRDYGVDTGAEGETPDYEGIIGTYPPSPGQPTASS